MLTCSAASFTCIKECAVYIYVFIAYVVAMFLHYKLTRATEPTLVVLNDIWLVECSTGLCQCHGYSFQGQHF